MDWKSCTLPILHSLVRSQKHATPVSSVLRAMEDALDAVACKARLSSRIFIVPSFEASGHASPSAWPQIAICPKSAAPVRRLSYRGRRIPRGPASRVETASNRLMARFVLLSVHPVIRTRHLDGNICEENPRLVAVCRPVMVCRDQERPCLLVAFPCHVNQARLCGPAMMENHFLDSIVGSNIDFPGIARGVTNIGGIFHHHMVGGTLSSWHFLHAFIFHAGAGVPKYVEWEDQPVLIVDETWIDLLLDVGRLAVDLGTHVCNLYGFAVLIFSFVGDPVSFGLPRPSS